MTVSFELVGTDRTEAPPFSDGCPKCLFDGAVVPHATVTQGNTLFAFYHHGRCGNQWSTAFGAQYSHKWQRVIGSQPRSIAA